MHHSRAETPNARDGSAMVFSGRGERKRVARGTLLFSEGDVATGVYVVYAGTIQLQHEASPTLTTRRTVGAGEILGITAVMSITRHTSSAVAQSACEIEFIEAQAFRRIVNESSSAWFAVLRQLSGELNRSYEMVRHARGIGSSTGGA